MLLAHGTFAKSALLVQNMNLKPSGKKSKIQDSFIPSDALAFHNISVVSLNFSATFAAIPIQTILEDLKVFV